MSYPAQGISISRGAYRPSSFLPHATFVSTNTTVSFVSSTTCSTAIVPRTCRPPSTVPLSRERTVRRPPSTIHRRELTVPLAVHRPSSRERAVAVRRPTVHRPANVPPAARRLPHRRPPRAARRLPPPAVRRQPSTVHRPPNTVEPWGSSGPSPLHKVFKFLAFMHRRCKTRRG